MSKIKGYGLVEVLVSVSIFMISITSANILLMPILYHAKEIANLQLILTNTLELTELLHIYQKVSLTEKQKLIQGWRTNCQTQLALYTINFTIQQTMLLVEISKQHFRLMVTIKI